MYKFALLPLKTNFSLQKKKKCDFLFAFVFGALFAFCLTFDSHTHTHRDSINAGRHVAEIYNNKMKGNNNNKNDNVTVANKINVLVCIPNALHVI